MTSSRSAGSSVPKLSSDEPIWRKRSSSDFVVGDRPEERERLEVGRGAHEPAQSVGDGLGVRGLAGLEKA